MNRIFVLTAYVKLLMRRMWRLWLSDNWNVAEAVSPNSPVNETETWKRNIVNVKKVWTKLRYGLYGG